MQRRRYLLVGLLGLLSVAIAGCGLQIGFIGSERTAAMSAHYTYCSSSKQRAVDLDEGDRLSFAYDMEVKSGTVSLSISDPEGEIVWQHDLEESRKEEFIITAEKSGNYQVRLDLKGTRGAYDVSWSKL